MCPIPHLGTWPGVLAGSLLTPLSLQLAPQRSSSVTLECTSPPDPFLQNMMDFEEFVPPVPPPPYYPPEYTCSSETDAQRYKHTGGECSAGGEGSGVGSEAGGKPIAEL